MDLRERERERERERQKARYFLVPFKLKHHRDAEFKAPLQFENLCLIEIPKSL